MQIKSNFNRISKKSALQQIVMLLFVLLASLSAGHCDPVDMATARQVAENVLHQHLEIYGAWNGSTAPIIADAQAVRYQNVTVAYNFVVAPSGHVLVAVDDAFSPVLLYSTDATFDPARVDQSGTLESLMIPALQKDVKALGRYRQMRSAAAAVAVGDDAARNRIRHAWSVLKSAVGSTSPTTALRSATDASTVQTSAVTAVGPLLSTAWDQGDPYNLDTPAVGGASGCAHTYTGCVATAWSQVLRYWSWPLQGQGSHSYTWNGQTLSADFSATTYDWADMPGSLDGTSSAVQKEAVALLMYQVGVAADTDYGCTDSGSPDWASDVLPTYFRYNKSTIQWCDRANKDANEDGTGGTGSPYTSAEWFALLTHELDADPPRPVILSLFTANNSGHEAVVDGYQEGSVDMVHINFGWSGYSDGFYNITSDFSAGGYTWTADQQDAVIGIEPDTRVSAGGNSSGGGGGGCFIGALSASLH